MLKRTSKFFGSLLALALVMAVAVPTTIALAVTSVNEDFEDGKADGFSVVSGTWKVISDDGNKVYKTASEEARSVAGDSASTNVSVQSRIKVKNWRTKEDRTAGLMARYSDINNYYLFIYEDGSLYIKKKVSGILTDVKRKRYAFKIRKWYTLKGEVDGDMLSFYVNGRLKLRGTDRSLDSGKVGCLTFNGNVRFDDFLASDLTDSPPPTPTGLAAKATSSSSIRVTYNSSEGATGYDVEVDGEIVDNGTELIYVHNGLAPESLHDYRVRARNPTGESEWSPFVSETTDGPGQSFDVFGIKMLYPTKAGGQPWLWDSQSFLSQRFSTQWDESHSWDDYVYLFGEAKYDCTGDGQLKVSKDSDGKKSPRIYIGDGTTAWDGNVEVTFYSKIAGVDKDYQGWQWGGLEAVVRTTHHPDPNEKECKHRPNELDCDTRGYAGRITLDGDADFEKEQSHCDDANSQSKKEYPWETDEVPMNQWLGYKLVVRDQGTSSNVHLELYLDKTSNGDLTKQKWEKIVDHMDVDYMDDDKIWDNQDDNFCCSTHKNKSLRGANATTQRFVYLRTDGVNAQYYKWISVREIDPEP